jgi:mRNA interferase MazF
MKRGDFVTVALSGTYGKPRPAIIVQSDGLLAVDSVLVAILSTHQLAAPLYRLSLWPSAENGLREPSDVLVEKIFAVPRFKIGPAFGRASDEQMLELNGMLAFVLGLSEPAAA